VSQPSKAVILESDSSLFDNKGAEPIAAQYGIARKDQYALNSPPADARLAPTGPGVTPHLRQARNAVRIAAAVGADVGAPGIFAKAKSLLIDAEDDRVIGTKEAVVEAKACEAIQTAEEARLISAGSARN
jgi:hypothetical protein